MTRTGKPAANCISFVRTFRFNLSKRTCYFFFVVVGAAIIFTGATLAVYVLKKSLKTIAGKYEFILLLGIFFFHLSDTFYEHYRTIISKDSYETQIIIFLFVRITAFFTLRFWAFMLIFDVWSTFR